MLARSGLGQNVWTACITSTGDPCPPGPSNIPIMEYSGSPSEISQMMGINTPQYLQTVTGSPTGTPAAVPGGFLNLGWPEILPIKLSPGLTIGIIIAAVLVGYIVIKR